MTLPLLGELEVLPFGYAQHPVVSPVTALLWLEERMTLMNTTRTWKCPDCGTTTRSITTGWPQMADLSVENATSTWNFSPKWLMMIVPLLLKDLWTKPTPRGYNPRTLTT